MLIVPNTRGTSNWWPRGIKPALALTSADVPHIQYMFEAQNGWVKESVQGNGVWDITTIANGYFYGPGSPKTTTRQRL